MAPVTRGKDQETMKTQQNAKITLYWLEKSRAQRILWLLEELHIPYSLKTYKRQSQFAPPELQSIHPLGKSPIVTIENTSSPEKKPLVLAESAFIVEYLIEHFGPGMMPERYADGKKEGEGEVGEETESWLRYRYFMHFAEGSMMGYLVVGLLLSNIKTQTPFFLRPLALLITSGIESKFLNPNLNRIWDFLESQLATSPNGGGFLCGDKLTGADVMMSTSLGGSRSRSFFTEKEHPKLCAYVDRMAAMEGAKRAVQKIVEVEGGFEDL